jgi:uncharacterized protein DUF4112
MKSRRKSSQEEDPVLEWLAWLMDESIRIGPWSIGLDGFIGLIPGVGDMAGAAVSAFFILSAMQAGIARSAIIRMVINVGVDSLLGALPFVGDIFDFAYKSNVRNLQIYREALRGDRRPMRDWTFIVFIVLVLMTIVALPILGLVYLARLLAPYMPTL